MALERVGDAMARVLMARARATSSSRGRRRQTAKIHYLRPPRFSVPMRSLPGRPAVVLAIATSSSWTG